MEFARFMASPIGRIIRAGSGAALVYFGLMSVGGVGGIIMALAGAYAFAAGALNFCGISKLIGAPFWGKDAAAK
ncbi:MAG: YgaP-like transmembrane domain [Myxococcaceae bacterium]